MTKELEKTFQTIDRIVINGKKYHSDNSSVLPSLEIKPGSFVSVMANRLRLIEPVVGKSVSVRG